MAKDNTKKHEQLRKRIDTLRAESADWFAQEPRGREYRKVSRKMRETVRRTLTAAMPVALLSDALLPMLEQALQQQAGNPSEASAAEVGADSRLAQLEAMCDAAEAMFHTGPFTLTALDK